MNSPTMTDFLLIHRAPVFSPNAVDRDRAILEAVGKLLEDAGASVRFTEEEELTPDTAAGIYVTMSRLQPSLDILKDLERKGKTVVNSAFGIERCARRTIDNLLRTNSIPAAPPYTDRAPDNNGHGDHTAHEFWLKRADMQSQTRGDVMHVDKASDIAPALRTFHDRDIKDVLITEHVAGDIVKFYGVYGTGLFRIFYPTDDGLTKFGDERFNGKAHHYAFSLNALHSDAERLSHLTDVKVYGGDCIVRPDGSYAIIDFNDWPSYSRCRDEAARAITSLLLNAHNSTPT